MHELNRILNTTENRVVQDSPDKDLKGITKSRQMSKRRDTEHRLRGSWTDWEDAKRNGDY